MSTTADVRHLGDTIVHAIYVLQNDDRPRAARIIERCKNRRGRASGRICGACIAQALPSMEEGFKPVSDNKIRRLCGDELAKNIFESVEDAAHAATLLGLALEKILF